ncbi:MAG: RNA 2',3'-cyclic phosphodiesterase [Gammaproteobacteria bacterium]|nr:RNA 2',3'-cyclic phosphodiesterase [Gammaproteobacteria bacterium]
MDVARAFLALDPDEALRAGLAALGEPLRAHFPYAAVRWSAPANYYFTLVFLGQVALADIPRIQACVTPVAAALPPFRYRLGAVRPFPTARSPRVIAALPADASGFLAWQQALAAALAGAGFAIERRPFRAHLSLGRWRSRSGCPPTADFALDLEGSATQVCLYESREGRYWPLFNAPCRGSDPGA